MPEMPRASRPPAPDDENAESFPSSDAGMQPERVCDDLGPADRVQWFGRPDAGEKPLGFWRLVVITLSAHIGVRPRAKRHEDFRRANGLHVFIAAIVYFVLVIAALIALINFVVVR
jgi:hypothetical protein